MRSLPQPYYTYPFCTIDAVEIDDQLHFRLRIKGKKSVLGLSLSDVINKSRLSEEEKEIVLRDLNPNFPKHQLE